MSRLLQIVDRTYRASLRIYPKAFRDEFGALMSQAFRDQCRRAHQEGLFALLRLMLSAACDLLRASAREHLTNLTLMNLFHNPRKASNVLLWTGIGLGFLSGAFHRMPAGIIAICYLTALIFIARAAVEWKRPHGDWWKGILTGLLIAVAYGLLMPAWAKMGAAHDLQMTTHAPAAFAAMLANLLVPLAKAALHFLQGRRPA